jgi:hypothetical protein
VIFLVIFSLFVALFVGEFVYELKTGKLLARGWKVIGKREDNPMWYWSSMALKSFIALFLLCLWVLTFLARND